MLHIGECATSDEIFMDALPWDAEEAREPDLVAAALKVDGDVAGELVPERSLESGPQG